jgi:hypothetical protein
MMKFIQLLPLGLSMNALLSPSKFPLPPFKPSLGDKAKPPFSQMSGLVNSNPLPQRRCKVPAVGSGLARLRAAYSYPQCSNERTNVQDKCGPVNYEVHDSTSSKKLPPPFFVRQTRPLTYSLYGHFSEGKYSTRSSGPCGRVIE